MIATAGRPELLGSTLESLALCRKPASYAETIVIENGEKSGAEEVARSSESGLRTRYLHIAVRNKSAALNAALDLLPDCLIHFIDDDARIGGETLCAYADAAAGLSGNVFFGGPVGIDYVAPPPEWLVEYLPASARGWQPLKLPRAPRDWAFLGTNWAAFSADLKRIGGFSEHLGPGSLSGASGQESEAQARMRRAGCARRYVPAAISWHFVPADRCSPEWAIDRFRRQGIFLAADLWQRGSLDSMLARYLVFARRMPKLALLLASPGAPYEFRRRYVRAFWDGFQHGLRSFDAQPPPEGPRG